MEQWVWNVFLKELIQLLFRSILYYLAFLIRNTLARLNEEQLGLAGQCTKGSERPVELLDGHFYPIYTQHSAFHPVGENADDKSIISRVVLVSIFLHDLGPGPGCLVSGSRLLLSEAWFI